LRPSVDLIEQLIDETRRSSELRRRRTVAQPPVGVGAAVAAVEEEVLKSCAAYSVTRCFE